MADSVQLDILKRLTAHMEGAVSAELGIDLAGRVYRGRMLYGKEMLLPSCSVLEAPRPSDGLPAGEEGVKRAEEWVLLVQGWVEDDAANPTDPAYNLKALVEQRLSEIIAVKPNGRGPVNPAAYMLGRRISGMTIGAGVVRPPDGQISDKAFFYLPVTIRMAVDITQPFVTDGQ